MSATDEQVFDSLVCINCMESARYAGELESAQLIRGKAPAETCEQCGGFLIDDECYNVTIRP